MACDDGCNCLVIAGNGLVVTGSGSARDPYKVAIDGDYSGNFNVSDTPSVNLFLAGNGTPEDPYELSAYAMLKLTELSDVSDPQGSPNVGDVPVWVGTGDTGHFEFQPPPANPGVVNVGTGLSGDGSLGAPLAVKLIGTTAGGPTSGLEIYADSAGNLRAVPPAVATVSWNSITGKPSTFPPSAHTHNAGDIISGTLPVARGGTGATSLSAITVGNANEIGGHKIFVQSGTPSGSLNDLWFW